MEACRGQSANRNGRKELEAGEGAALCWWVCSSGWYHAGQEALLPGDPHDPDGKTWLWTKEDNRVNTTGIHVRMRHI